MGIKEDSNKIIVVLFDTNDTKLNEINKLIQGDKGDINTMYNYFNQAETTKLYKLTTTELVDKENITRGIVNRIATHDI